MMVLRWIVVVTLGFCVTVIALDMVVVAAVTQKPSVTVIALDMAVVAAAALGF